jgi:hypothetical protein
MSHINYRSLKKYKYQLMRNYKYETGICINHDVKIQGFVALSPTGTLNISLKAMPGMAPAAPPSIQRILCAGALCTTLFTS